MGGPPFEPPPPAFADRMWVTVVAGIQDGRDWRLPWHSSRSTRFRADVQTFGRGGLVVGMNPAQEEAPVEEPPSDLPPCRP